jgi:serine/threonine protein kinase
VGFIPPLSVEEVEAALGSRYLGFSPVFSGGQAQVFRSRSLTGRSVAVKIYYPEQLQERTEREVKALLDLSGPTLVRLDAHGMCTLRGQQCVFVATDFIDGVSVQTRLANRSPFSVTDVLRLGADVAAAIDLVWSRRIVHRDIKPANVMVGADGRSILIDLGVAKHLGMGTLTTAGKTWGTLGYMSPEQFQGWGRLSCKSDVFALGVLLQESLCGHHPTAHQQHGLANGGASTKSLFPSVPPELGALIDGMLAKRPTLRPLPSSIVTQCQQLLSKYQ